MIKINRQTDYAIRVVLALARSPVGKRLSSETVQQRMLIPPAFLRRIVAELAHAGLIRTFPGREGGLQLARSSEKITLRDVYEAIEGPLLVSECFHSGSTCPMDTPCPVQVCWVRIQAAIARELESVTFHDLADGETWQ
jgi:Rrf2 family protein